MASVRPAPSPRRHCVRRSRSRGCPSVDRLALKFRHRRVRRRRARPAHRAPVPLQHVDVVTWAPTNARRARRRGYDQAEAIAQAIARQLGVPCRRLLYRAHGTPQTGKSRSRPPGGPGLPRPPASCRPDGAGRRRRRHHRGHVAGSGPGAACSRREPMCNWSPRPAPSCARRRWSSCDQWQADRALPRSGSTSPVGCAPAWASSIASSALVKARS